VRVWLGAERWRGERGGRVKGVLGREAGGECGGFEVEGTGDVCEVRRERVQVKAELRDVGREEGGEWDIFLVGRGEMEGESCEGVLAVEIWSNAASGGELSLVGWVVAVVAVQLCSSFVWVE